MKKSNLIFLIIFLFTFSKNCFSEYFAVEGEITAMIYKKGWIVNKWVPVSIDGLYIGKEKKPRPLPRNFKAKIVTFFGSKSSRKGKCRIEYRHLRGVWYWRKSWEIGKGKPFEREDYLKFNCMKY